MRIVFMGTPDFAASALRSIAGTGDDIVGVITQPDKPQGRGYRLTPPPVKVTAEELGICDRVYQPEKVRTQEFAELLTSLSPDLIVVAAYGKILPKNVLDLPPCGCVNIHSSLLPKYRGAAPIQRAIMAGEHETGITVMYMDEGLDTGDMILKKCVTIEDGDNFETLHDKLAAIGADAIVEAIAKIKDGSVTRTPQPDCGAVYAAKIENDDMVIDFTRSRRELHNQIRGLSPTPLAFTHTPDGRLFKLIKSEIGGENVTNAVPGTVVDTDGGVISVACGDGIIRILACQPEGGRRMSSQDAVNGRRVRKGDVLS